MKTLLSLFDYSGTWSEPFAMGGWNVITWDIKLCELMDIKNIDLVETALDLFEDVDGILAAVPCTDFASSGAQYWPQKDRDGRTKLAMELVDKVECLVDLFTPTDPDYEEGFFWSLENPVGRLGKLYPHFGKPFYFNPCDFAGYLNLSDSDHNELDRLRRKDGINMSREEVDFILNCEAYTKKTCLWGNFNRNIKKMPIEPVKACRQGSPLQVFGGSSDKTKEVRSISPLGFSRAFYYANRESGQQYREDMQLSLF